MRRNKSASEKKWLAFVASFRCIICKRFGSTGTRTHAHHIATGSGVRSDFCSVPLCYEHHQGSSGLHGMGNTGFVKFYRVPGETEYGLLVWFLQDIAERLELESGRAWNEM